MKIAIVTDSNSGITQKEGKELGISVIPMPFMADGKTYFEDIDLNHEDFFQMLARGADISTSQPAPQDVTRLWDELLKEYEAIVHIPMSSGLSGSCQTAMMLAQDYEGKVFVVNNQRISVTQRQSVMDALGMAQKGYTAEQIKNRLEETKFDSSIYITVDTLKYLKKRRTGNACGSCPGNPSADQAGIDDPGREAGCFYKGPHHEAGQKRYAVCHPERYGDAVRR